MNKKFDRLIDRNEQMIGKIKIAYTWWFSLHLCASIVQTNGYALCFGNPPITIGIEWWFLIAKRNFRGTIIHHRCVFFIVELLYHVFSSSTVGYEVYLKTAYWIFRSHVKYFLSKFLISNQPSTNSGVFHEGRIEGLKRTMKSC